MPERDPRPALVALYGFFFAYMGIIQPYLPAWLREHGFGPSVLAVLLALQPVAKLVAPWTWGRWADRSGKRRLLLGSGLLSGAAAIAVLSSVDALVPVALALGLLAFGTSPALPFAEATALEQAERRGFRYGPVRLWGSLGYVAAAAGFGVVLDRAGPGWSLVGACGLLALAAAAAGRLPQAEGASSPKGRTAGSVFSQLRETRSTRLLAGCALMQVSHGGYYAFYTLRLQDLGYPGWSIGALWAFAVLSEVALLTRADDLVDRFGTSAVQRVSLMAASARWLVIGFLAVPALLVAAQMLHALTYAAFHVASLREIHRRFGPGRRATGQALYSGLTYGLGIFVGTLVAGPLVDRAGYGALFLFCAAMPLLALVVLDRRR